MNSINKIFNNKSLDCDIRYDELMSNHTSFGIGGKANCIVFPRSISQIKNILKILNENDIEFQIVGSGTNMLVSDKGYKGVIVSLKKTFKKIEFSKSTVIVESGVMLGTMVKEAVKRNIGGLESLGGVPGTVGGALFMNAGAFGSEISNYFDWAMTIDKEGKQKEYYKNDVKFSYRSSSFPSNEIITKCRFNFFMEEIKKIKEKKLDSSKKRKNTQPLKYRSAGSIFKNPEGSMAAGYLIDKAGLKGYRKGGAEISKKHANFIINKGSAKCSDVLFLINLIKDKVKMKFDVNLELEVKVLD